jgi:hypothetical protein
MLGPTINILWQLFMCTCNKQLHLLLVRPRWVRPVTQHVERWPACRVAEIVLIAAFVSPTTYPWPYSTCLPWRCPWRSGFLEAWLLSWLNKLLPNHCHINSITMLTRVTNIISWTSWIHYVPSLSDFLMFIFLSPSLLYPGVLKGMVISFSDQIGVRNFQLPFVIHANFI